MAQSLATSRSTLDRWRGASWGAFRSIWRRDERHLGPEATQELSASLNSASDTGRKLAAQIESSEDSQSLANAASICRWELLILRERVLEGEGSSSVRTEIVRHLDGAAAAARTLSSGYRYHNLNRICDGGQLFEEHMEALTHLHARLGGQ
jgi:hypothetical protein